MFDCVLDMWEIVSLICVRLTLLCPSHVLIVFFAFVGLSLACVGLCPSNVLECVLHMCWIVSLTCVGLCL